MTPTTAPPPPRRPPAAAYKVLNPLLGLILRSPMHGPLGRRLLLLTFAGRKSGRRYTIPVGYVRDGDTLLLGTESRWKANLHGGARVRVRLQGRERTGAAAVIDDEAGMTAALATMVRAVPDYGRIVGVGLGPDGRPDPADVDRARRRGSVVIRIRLDGPHGADSA